MEILLEDVINERRVIREYGITKSQLYSKFNQSWCDVVVCDSVMEKYIKSLEFSVESLKANLNVIKEVFDVSVEG